MFTLDGVRRLVFGGAVRVLAAGLAFSGAAFARGPAQELAPAGDAAPARPPALSDSRGQVDIAQAVAAQNASSIDLVRRALATNASLAAARLDVERARARLRQAGLQPNPTLDFEQRTGRLTGSAGEGETSVGVSIPLELFGQRGRRIDLAEAEIDAAEAGIAERERQLASEVRARYAEALAARRELEIVGELAKIDAETARFVAVRVNEGESAPLEYRLLQVEIARLDSRRAVVEGRFQAALVELRMLTGLAADEPVSLGEDLTRVAWGGASPPLDQAIATALRTRPDLRLARLEERVAEAGLRLVRAQAAPDVTAFGRFSVEKSVFDDTPAGVLRDRDRTLSFGVSIGIPVFNRNQGARAEAETGIAQARKRREYAEQRVRAEVVSAFARLRAADAAVAAYEQGVIPRSNDNLRSIRGAYQVGAYRITELLAEQRRLVDAEREYTETLAERFRALADLQTAIGLAVPFGERQPAATPEITSVAPRDYPGAHEPALGGPGAPAVRLPIAIDGGADTSAVRPKATKKNLSERGPKQ
jgi:cobalt-zinc-cadmium efflux system outer membrane protein